MQTDEATVRERLDQLWLDTQGCIYLSDEVGQERLNRFVQFLDAEAYLDAAMMMASEEWMVSLDVECSGAAVILRARDRSDRAVCGPFADTPALALIEAITLAQEPHQ